MGFARLRRTRPEYVTGLALVSLHYPGAGISPLRCPTPLLCESIERVQERLKLLRTREAAPPIQYGKRHALDATALNLLQVGAHYSGILACLQRLTGGFPVQSDSACKLN